MGNLVFPVYCVDIKMEEKHNNVPLAITEHLKVNFEIKED